MRYSQEQLAKLVERMGRLEQFQLEEVERLVGRMEALHNTTLTEKRGIGRNSQSTDWPHAPLHRLEGKGTDIVTAGTLNKERLFRESASLDFLEGELLRQAKEYGWQLEAWSVFSNHYHFVGRALEDATSLKPFLTHLHADTARRLNERDETSGRQVWFNYWETALTYEKSYFARLNYVHQNPVRHGLVSVASQYRWCSAAWFERTATPAQVKTIYGFKTDKVNVIDDFGNLTTESQ